MFSHLSVMFGGRVWQTLPRQTPPGADSHWADTPRQTPLRDGHCRGRYASYWNAFLLSRWIARVFFFLSTVGSPTRGAHSCFANPRTSGSRIYQWRWGRGGTLAAGGKRRHVPSIRFCQNFQKFAKKLDKK